MNKDKLNIKFVRIKKEMEIELPLTSYIGNEYGKRIVGYLATADKTIWAYIVKVRNDKGTLSFRQGVRYYWRLTYVNNGEYVRKEFKKLKEAKEYAKKIILEKYGLYE